jgi:integrase
MRGLHATLAVDAGISGQVVATALGHESFRTTEQSYAKAGSVSKAKHERALKALGGGRK